MFFVLASILILSETFQSLLQDIFAWLSLYMMEYMQWILLGCGACVVGIAWYRVTTRKQLDHPTPCWGILTVLNYVMVVLALGSTMVLFRDTEMGLLEKGSCCAIAGSTLAYFYGFFGISFVTSATSEEFQKEQVAYDADVLVIGAGTAGAAMAYVLAEQGKKVVVIEKNMTLQDRIVGELMQPGGLDALRQLGLEDCALGVEQDTLDSVPIHGYVVISKEDDEEMWLPYPDRVPQTFREYFGIDRLPNGTTKPMGRGFHNGRFVQKLRQKLQHENIQIIEGVATKFIESSQFPNRIIGMEYKRNDEKELDERRVHTMYAPLTIVADGMWSALRKDVVASSCPEVISNFVGLIMTHQPHQSPVPRANHGHVILAKPSPILMYQISSTETRVLVDIPGKLPRNSNGELAQYLKEFVCPQLPTVSQQPFLRGIEAGIKSMPNRSLVCTQPNRMGAMLLGDAFNMRHPLTGGGMTVALKDVALMASLLANISSEQLENESTMSQFRESFQAQRRGHASTVNILANALYHVFSAPKEGNSIRKYLRNSCYDYLHQDGVYAAGPIGLLSGLTPKPFVLIMHFFMVAWYCMYQCCVPFPTWSKIQRAWHILHLAVVIILPLIEKESIPIISSPIVLSMINWIFPFYHHTLDEF